MSILSESTKQWYAMSDLDRQDILSTNLVNQFDAHNGAYWKMIARAERQGKLSKYAVRFACSVLNDPSEQDENDLGIAELLFTNLARSMPSKKQYQTI